MKYVIGLDIGIASVGWSVVDIENKRIVDIGVRTFSKAETPKTGASLAEPRRLARGSRRRLARRAERLQRTKQLLVDFALIKASETESAFLTKDETTPWDLRAAGLERKLKPAELARAVFHIVKHRGFKSNKKSDKNAKEDTAMLGSIKDNRDTLISEGYRTVGEMVYKNEKFSLHKRNVGGCYTATFSRDMLEDEIKTLLGRQRELGSEYATEQMQRSLLDIFNWQKPFASGDDILKKFRECSFEEGELRAPKYCYTVEIFDLIHSINTRLRWTVAGKQHTVSPEQMKTIIDQAHAINELTYGKIRKLLDIPDEARFDCLSYRSKDPDASEADIVKDVEKKFHSLTGYHSIKKVCEEHEVWDEIKDDADILDAIGYALTVYKNDPEILEYLATKGISSSIADAVVHCAEFRGTSKFSLKAIKKFLPYMKEGQQYHEACVSAGYNHALSSQTSQEKKLKLRAIDPEEVRNPVVIRALSQARKVINSIIDRYGSPWRIQIELARDMGKTKQKRDEIENTQKENASRRKRLEEEFTNIFGREPNSTDLLKFRLYNEQQCKCIYSLKPIDIDRLFENNYAEIDHILPRSRSFDDSRKNKVLVLASENQNKQNKTPYEYFGHDEQRWSAVEAYAKSIYMPVGKRNRLLKKEFNESAENEWRTRNLNDTRYITRFISDHIRQHLMFSEQNLKQTVVCLNGQLVAQARWLWGLEKDRKADDLHHALDATVIAVLQPHQQEQLTRHFQAVEIHHWRVDPETGEVFEGEKPQLPYPWKHFRKELLARLSDNPAEHLKSLDLPAYSQEDIANTKPIMVSRMPARKIGGEIHEDSIRSAKRVSKDGKSTIRKPLTSLKVGDLANLSNPEANKKLYAEIRARMEEFDNKADKAFAKPIYKPSANGLAVVRRVTVEQTQNTGVPVRGGLANNGEIVRTDVFRKNGKYYLVPVYTKEMQRGVLPNRAVVAYKPEDKWMEVTDDEFVTSLYPFDLIYFECGDTSGFFYYRGCHRGTGALNLSDINNISDKPGAKGVQKATIIQRYEMGILGDCHPVRKKEVRHGVENRGHNKRRKTEN